MALAVQGLLWFHIYFRVSHSNSEKNDIGMLIRIALNLHIALDILIHFYSNSGIATKVSSSSQNVFKIMRE